ncbi:MAG: UbiA family prenyltransferase [Deltaproteobacteria bacterium]|nr:UbiA family prenyltransferase [Deltaproteobacteria bacterium]
MPSTAYGPLGELASILRLHIVLIGVVACVVFGYLLTGRYVWGVALLGGVDWLLINLLNRITDLTEDLANGIRGTERVARHRRAFIVTWLVVEVGSFALSHALVPSLTPWRLVVQLIGAAYSIPLVPTLRGLRRFKDLYFLKNFMSAALFCLTGVAYPLVATAAAPALPGGWLSVAALLAFFVPFELTYEIFYDLRDLEGDRLAGVPTYPVVHGPRRAEQIIHGLLLGSAAVLTAALLAGLVGLREGLMLAAPAVQLAFIHPRIRRGPTTGDCILATHLGSALLVVFLVGTALWIRAGLPDNIFLRAF